MACSSAGDCRAASELRLLRSAESAPTCAGVSTAFGADERSDSSPQAPDSCRRIRSAPARAAPVGGQVVAVVPLRELLHAAAARHGRVLGLRLAQLALRGRELLLELLTSWTSCAMEATSMTANCACAGRMPPKARSATRTST